MKDRLSKYPGRVKLTPVAGQADTFDMIRADEPEEAGTPLNKNSLLKDETAVELGLDPADDPTPDDAFGKLAKKSDTKAGDLLETMRNDLGDNWLLCNGEVLPRENYPALRKWLDNNTGERVINFPLVSATSCSEWMPLVNGKWFFLANPTNAWTVYSGDIYDPNTDTHVAFYRPVVNATTGSSEYYKIMGVTHDGEKYIMVVGYPYDSDTTARQTFVFTSEDAVEWEESFSFTMTSAYFKTLYFDGERVLLGRPKSRTTTSSSGGTLYHYSITIYQIDTEAKTITEFMDIPEVQRAGEPLFLPCPNGYWRLSGSYQNSDYAEMGHAMYRTGETQPCFEYNNCGDNVLMFNDRFCMTIRGGGDRGTTTFEVTKTAVFDQKTGEKTVISWNSFLGVSSDAGVTGAFYDEKTNEWKIYVKYTASSTTYYKVLYVSADADPRDIMAYRVEDATGQQFYENVKLSQNKSQVRRSTSSGSYVWNLYDSDQRYLPTLEAGEAYKYIYAAGEAEEEEHEPPKYETDEMYAPEGYERLECIESTGEQYIDTGFVPKGNIESLVRATCPARADASNVLYGVRSSTTATVNAYDFFYYAAGGYYNGSYGNSNQQLPTDATTDDIIIVYRKTYYLYANGYGKASNGSFTDSAYTLYLFGRNNVGTPVCGLCKIYYAKFRNTDGTPIRDFIPVRRLSDGAVGLWDKVTEEFYGNAGTGEFIAHEMEETA